PEFFAAGSVKTGEDAANTQRDDLSIGHRGRTAWPRVPGGRSRRSLSVVLIAPEFFAGSGIEASDDFRSVLPGKNVEFIAGQTRRGVAVAHNNPPLPGQFLGPAFGCVEPAGFPVPINPPPLGPVLRPGTVYADC